MTAADRQLLEALPPDLTAAALLRRALAEYRAAASACEHRRVICADCAAELAELDPHTLEDVDGAETAETMPGGQGQLPPSQRESVRSPAAAGPPAP